ncbi:Wsp signal transduction system sensor histidine kinase WspE [Massilia terrae]
MPDQDLSAFSLFDLFRLEAEGQSRVLTEGLLALERGAAPGALEPLMRAAHSLKGAAAIVALEPAVRLAHEMEDALLALNRAGAVPVQRIDALLAGVDLLQRLAQVGEAGLQDWLAANQHAFDAAIGAIGAPVAVAPPVAAQPVAEEAGAMPATPVQQASDELLALASQARLQALQFAPFITSLERYKRSQAGVMQLLEQLRDAATASRDPHLADLAALVMARAEPLKGVLLSHIAEADEYQRHAVTVTSRLADQVLALRMCPIGDGLHSFPRMARDLARSLGKKVRVDLAGADTMVDRAILPRIEGALTQMLRNALDHGIEMPDERRAAGKPEEGAIRIGARHLGGMLLVEVADDGRGVDPQRIRDAAVRHQRATAAIAARLPDAELMEFLFLPGFSLKESANELSGRGVGLDVVHDLAVSLNGSLRAESRPGQGFALSLTLPLTQSVVRALVVDIGGEPYALPIARVERVLKLPQGALVTRGGQQYIDLAGEWIGVVGAAQVLGLGCPDAGPELSLVVIGGGHDRCALAVDAIRGEQTLTVQPLEPMFGALRDVACGAILDSGAPVLVLDVPSLLVSTNRLLHEGALQHLGQPDDAAGRRRVLVVDDSLTVREMERKVLAAHGYKVDVAVDGMDGWNMLRSADYDLLVTDVDMPRMDGIELVTLLRADARLQRMPVMIVSYKDRMEDRARGLHAGADYYLAKGSFHERALLDAVADLIGGPLID